MSVKDYITITIVVVVFGAGWQTHAWYSSDTELRILKAINDTQDKAANAAAIEIAKIKVEQTTVNKYFKERTTTETVYKECAHSDDSFSIIKGLFK